MNDIPELERRVWRREMGAVLLAMIATALVWLARR